MRTTTEAAPERAPKRCEAWRLWMIWRVAILRQAAAGPLRTALFGRPWEDTQ